MKPRPVEYEAGADRDIEEILRWYSDENPKLAEQFLLDLENSVDRISLFPESCPLDELGMRHCLLHRFPYAIFYDYDGASVTVLAIGHTAREPGFWRDRADDAEQ